MNDKAMELKLQKAILRGAQLLVDNGLGDWKIKLNNKRTALAETWHKEKTIAYSQRFIMIADEDQFVGVTLHEATHALLGVGHGHDGVFARMCTKISPTDVYARRAVDIPLGKYILTCPECGYTGSSNLRKERFCGTCWKAGKTIKFDIKDNELKVKEW